MAGKVEVDKLFVLNRVSPALFLHKNFAELDVRAVDRYVTEKAGTCTRRMGAASCWTILEALSPFLKISCKMIAVITTVRNGLLLEENLVSVAARSLLSQLRWLLMTDQQMALPTGYRPTGKRSKIDRFGTSWARRALNIGLQAAQSEFVAILDADDFASSVWLQEMLKFMQLYPQIDVLGCRGVMLKNQVENTPSDRAVPKFLEAGAFLTMNPVHHSGTLIRRQVLAKVGGYDEERKILLDYALWVTLLEAGACIANLDQGYIFRRVHKQQHFESRNRLEYLRGCFSLRRRVSKRLLNGRGWAVPYLAFVYGLLPQKFRHAVRHYGRYLQKLQGKE